MEKNKKQKNNKITIFYLILILTITITNVQAYVPSIPDMSSHYTFNEENGTTAKDYFNLTNLTLTREEMLTSNVTGEVLTGIDFATEAFSGHKDTANFNNFNNFNKTNIYNNGGFTISTFIKYPEDESPPPDRTGRTELFTLKEGINKQIEIALNTYTPDRTGDLFEFSLNDDGNYTAMELTREEYEENEEYYDENIFNNEWNHYVFKFNFSNSEEIDLSVYVNGVKLNNMTYNVRNSFDIRKLDYDLESDDYDYNIVNTDDTDVYLDEFSIIERPINDDEINELQNIENNYYYNGLVCNEDKTECYNETGVCFPQEDDQYLCENVKLVENDYTYYFYCDTEDLTYCGECDNEQKTNEFDITYLDGSCSDDIDCTNECRIEGETYSDSSTTYKKCGFYDDDVCLEWSNSKYCSTGEVSVDGSCVEQNVSSKTYFTLDNFRVIPELIKSTTYNFDVNPPEANFKTQFPFITIGVDYEKTSSDSRIKQVCNYESEELHLNEDERELNNSISVNVNDYDNGITKVNLEMRENQSVNVKALDLSDDTLFNYTLYNNDSNQFCVYDEDNEELIGCESIRNNYLTNVEFSVQTIYEYGFFSTSTKTKIISDTNYENFIYSGFRNTNKDGVYNKLIITSDDDVNVTETKITNEKNNDEPYKSGNFYYTFDEKEEAFNALLSSGLYDELRSDLTLTQIRDYYDSAFNFYDKNRANIRFYPNPCFYNEEGTYNLRVYETQDVNKNGYWNHKDFLLNVEKLGALRSDTEQEESFLNKLSSTEKLLFAFLVLFFVVTGFMTIGYFTDQLKLLTFIGTFLGVGTIIYFSIIGFVPVWILIIMFTLSAVVIGSIITNWITNRG